jgi:CheY-like chemotaxis protein
VGLKETTLDDALEFKAGPYLELTITDTGEGIPQEHLASVFDPYFTTKPVGQGTGMGLAVVHGIVEGYGGKILVDSTIAKGTTFTVFLPIVKKRRQPQPDGPVELPLGSERILFVDDEAPITRMGRQILERLGYKVTTRTSSQEALALFRRKPDDFDLVITDLTMPHMTGEELALAILRIRPNIPVILCSGYSDKISEATAAKLGIRAFVYKPAVKADMAQRVREVLDGTRSQAPAQTTTIA